MAGDGIKADLQRIGGVSQRVAGIAAEFEATTQMASGYAQYLGSAELTSALDSFANGWAKHRAALIADLKDTAAKADLAVQEYRGTDDKLAAALPKGH
jgi:hypothetical protein